MVIQMVADANGYEIELNNQELYKDMVCNVGMHNRTPTLEQCMELLAVLDTSLIKSQPGSASGTNAITTMKVSARTMDCKNGGTTGTAGTARDNSLTWYHCSQDGHISRNSPNCNLMKKLLEHALVDNDALNVKSRRPHKDKIKGGAPTGQQESGRHVKVK